MYLHVPRVTPACTLLSATSQSCSPARRPNVVLACRASMYMVKTQWEREEA